MDYSISINMKRTLLLLTIFALSPLLNAQNMGGSPDPIDGSIYHTGGNVGIGTTSPSTLLSIGIADTGNQYGKGIQIKRGSGYLKFQNGTATSLFSPNITGKATTNWATAGLFIKGIPTNDQTDFAGIILIAGESAPLVNADVLRIRNYSTDLFTINSGGRVGIGTTTPNSKLEIGVPHAINQDEEIRIGSYWQGNFLGLGFNYTINNIGTVSKHLVEHHEIGRAHV